MKAKSQKRVVVPFIAAALAGFVTMMLSTPGTSTDWRILPVGVVVFILTAWIVL